MTSATVLRCTTASGKSLNELSRLIALRAERLGELTRDAVIAAAIDVLISLRAATGDARKTKSTKPLVVSRGFLFPSFHRDGGMIRPCLRQGSPHGPRFNIYFRIDPAVSDFRTARVFSVTPEHERLKPYCLVANSGGDTLEYENRRAMKRIELKGGLAKTALGIAMAKLSTRNADSDSPALARALASNLSHVTVYGSGTGSGDFGLSYSSDLDYAIAALDGGAAGVDAAMQKAANKIAGLITHAAHAAGDFEHDIPTPFPEVKKRQ